MSSPNLSEFLTSKDIKDLNKVLFDFMGEIVSGQDYIKKGDENERQQRKLKFRNLSASVGNFRAKQEDRFPSVRV